MKNMLGYCLCGLKLQKINAKYCIIHKRIKIPHRYNSLFIKDIHVLPLQFPFVRLCPIVAVV